MNNFRIALSNCPDWTLADGSREFIANWHDAISKAVNYQPVSCTRQAWDGRRVLYHAVTADGKVHGALAWDSRTKDFICANLGVAITVDNMSVIGCSDKRGTNAIGTYGEGIKGALGPLARRGCTVAIHSTELQSSSGYHHGAVFASDEQPDPSITVRNATAEQAASVRKWMETSLGVWREPWTYVCISNVIERDDVAWDRFLFLLPPQRVVSVYANGAHPELSILDGAQFKGRVFVRRVFVCERNDLPFGICLGAEVRMNRDRSTLRESSAQLLGALVKHGSSRCAFSPRFLKKMLATLNVREPPPTFIQFVHDCIDRDSSSWFRTALLQYCIKDRPVARGSNQLTQYRYVGCSSNDNVTPDQRRLLALQPRNKVRKVCSELFRFLWPIQKTALNNYYSQLLDSLRGSAIDVARLSAAVRSKHESLLSFLRGLLAVDQVTIVVADSQSLHTSAAYSRLPVYDRLPCVWNPIRKELLLDVKLFRRDNVHKRIRADMQRESDRADEALFWTWQECTDAHCACLVSTVMQQVQLLQGLSSAYCTRFMLNWAKSHHAAVEAARQAGHMEDAMADLGLEPGDEGSNNDSSEDEQGGYSESEPDDADDESGPSMPPARLPVAPNPPSSSAPVVPVPFASPASVLEEHKVAEPIRAAPSHAMVVYQPSVDHTAALASEMDSLTDELVHQMHALVVQRVIRIGRLEGLSDAAVQRMSALYNEECRGRWERMQLQFIAMQEERDRVERESHQLFVKREGNKRRLRDGDE